MKHLLTALSIIVMAAMAQANSDLMIRYEFGMPTSSDAWTAANLVTVEITDSGLMTIQEGPIVAYMHESIEEQTRVVRHKLTDMTAIELLDKARTLANTEIETIDHMVVCEVAVPMWQTYDNLYLPEEYVWHDRAFTGEFRLVDGPHGCWVGHQVHPKIESYDRMAIELKAQLHMLARELLNIK
jgi:hypothetical protein